MAVPDFSPRFFVKLCAVRFLSLTALLVYCDVPVCSDCFHSGLLRSMNCTMLSIWHFNLAYYHSLWVVLHGCGKNCFLYLCVGFAAGYMRTALLRSHLQLFSVRTSWLLTSMGIQGTRAARGEGKVRRRKVKLCTSSFGSLFSIRASLVIVVCLQV